MKPDNNQFQQSKIDKVFAHVKDENGKIHITCGGYSVSTKKFDTFKQAELYLASMPWEIIVNVCGMLINKREQYEKEMEKDTTENNQNA